MLNNIDTSKLLFLDIETVPLTYRFSELNDTSKSLWDKKTKFLQEREGTSADKIYEKAGIYAEFGKIICISVGFMVQVKGEHQIRLKSFSSSDEKEVLQGFIDLLNSHYNHNSYMLCAHNGKEFDFPYISRRLLINQMKLPKLLDNAGKKPWEINNIDTLELWKFGDYKHYTSLELLTNIFNIPTPKDDIDGSQVAKIFYEDNDLDRIINYCEKDVVATIQLFQKYRGEELIDPAFIIST
ncbi:MAG: 3'-5' exonuclease [Crocinitomicaceae bacterium]|nr:3'-5' exonuclease [Crocinitomicaceae bacterium]|tara:strand:- start:594 stop:1313 length:720 start_codon:yes stop_codon:yes gene_type:complete